LANIATSQRQIVDEIARAVFVQDVGSKPGLELAFETQEIRMNRLQFGQQDVEGRLIPARGSRHIRLWRNGWKSRVQRCD
jgi:hypothetical protein